MQTENVSQNNASNSAEAQSTLFSNLKEGLSSNRTRRTVAAIVGAGVGVGITALSPRSNNLTLALTAGFGALEVVGVYKNDFLEDHFETDVGTLGFIAGSKAVETALFGFVANHVVGTEPKTEEAVEAIEAVPEVSETAQVIILQPQQ